MPLLANRQSTVDTGPLFACVFVPHPASTRRTLVDLAREFSSRVEVRHDWLVLLDVGGLGRMIGNVRASGVGLGGPTSERAWRGAGDPAMEGNARAIGLELGRASLRRGWVSRVAVAPTRVAALVMAHARPGLTIVPPGEEARVLAPVPIGVLEDLWGLGTGGWGLGQERGTRNAERVRQESGGRRRGASCRHYRLAPAPLLEQLQGSRFNVQGSANQQSAISNQQSAFATLRRWGLRTLGDLAALPSAELSARLGPDGPALQRIARGEDPRPLVPAQDPERFEASCDLEWPIEGLEPLSFVLARLLEPLCARLERADRGAAALAVRLTLTTREVHARVLPLSAPLRDPRALRTLALLDLESHPPPAGVDRVAVAVEPVEGRVTQFSLVEYPRPSPEQLSTLLARLNALMGEGRSGAPALVDTHRPGACAIEWFDPETGGRRPEANNQGTEVRGVSGGAGLQPCEISNQQLAIVNSPASGPRPPASDPRPPTPGVLRRFRVPVVARVALEEGRPARVTTARRGLAGGRVDEWAGPWRTSGWGPASSEKSEPWDRGSWDRDEWDVLVADGSVYRLFRDRAQDRWFVEGIVD